MAGSMVEGTSTTAVSHPPVKDQPENVDDTIVPGVKRDIESAGETNSVEVEGAKRSKIEPNEEAAHQSKGLESMLPPPPQQEADAVVEQLCGTKLTLGTKLEVLWEVGDDADEEAKPTAVFWPCHIDALVGAHAELGPLWKLKYQQKDVEGSSFPAEERVVAFSAPHMLVDTGGENPDGEEESRLIMQWRIEGTTPELEELLPAGTTVWVRAAEAIPAALPSGDNAEAAEVGETGEIATMHADGTYLVALDNGESRDRVKRQLLEVVDEEDGVVADSIDSFFELFTSQIMQGATYRNLPTEKQRIAADKFASWRPIFKEELEALTEGQTSDYVVTGEDIHSIIPKVMRRAAELEAGQGLVPKPAGLQG